MSEMRTYWTTPVTTVDLTTLIAERDALRAELAAVREQLNTAEVERNDYRTMYLDLWDAAKRHETEANALRHRAERMAAVVEAAKVFVQNGTNMSLSSIAMRSHWLALYETVNALDPTAPGAA